MRIKNFRKSTIQHYADVEPGMVFIHDNTFYMATDTIVNFKNVPINAVDLKTGKFTLFFFDDEIEIVSAELCIH